MRTEDASVEDGFLVLASWLAGAAVYVLSAVGVLIWIGYVVAIVVLAQNSDAAVWVTIGLGFALALVVDLVLGIVGLGVCGAFLLFGYASNFGLFGQIAYVILLVSFFPVIAVVSVIVGALFIREHWRELFTHGSD